MTKPASTIKEIRKQHSPEFRQEVLKLAERIGCRRGSLRAQSV